MTNTLISKIAKASLKVGALETDKTNTQQNYKYISADKILERGGDALCEAGVVIIPSITQETTEAVKTDKGGTRYDSIVHFLMTITDGETQLEMPWCGRGNDYSVPDKALYKAITSGHKYFLMKLLNIGVGNEDGEHESDGQPAQAPQKPATAQKQPSGQNATRSHESPPHARLWGQGQSAFGNDWDMARPWLISKWTSKVTPDKVRDSASELSEDEKDMLADYIKDNLSALQGIWKKQKAAMLQGDGVAA
jgi:hypothetical protein